MPESEDLRPERANCRRYHAGHTPHAIQVRLSEQSPPDEWRPVVVLGTEGDIVVLAVDGALRRFRNHDTALLSWVVERVGVDAMLNPGYHALFCMPWPDGASSVFSLQDADDEPLPCTPRD